MNPYTLSDKERKEFLERNYHYLTRTIRPHEFFTWLRSKNALSIDDVEEVQGRYITTFLRAGCLVDIIIRKGKTGFNAFMEVIEYSYPELYENLTNTEPRTPPPDFDPTRRRVPSSRRRCTGISRSSIDIYKMLSDLSAKLMVKIENKEVEVEGLQSLISDLQKRLEEEETEKASLNGDLELARDYADQLTNENEELKKQMSLVKEEMKKLTSMYEETRALKEQHLNDLLRLRKDCDLKDGKMRNLEGEVIIERQKSIAIRPMATIDNLKKKNEDLEKELDALKLQFQPNKGAAKSNEQNWAATEISSLRSKLAECEKKCDALSCETELIQNKLKQSDSQCTVLQQSKNQWEVTVEQLKQENETLSRRIQDSEKKYKESSEENERLKSECKELEERFRVIEETNRKLRQEIKSSIEFRQRSRPVDHRARPLPYSDTAKASATSTPLSPTSSSIVHVAAPIRPPGESRSLSNLEAEFKRHGSTTWYCRPLVLYAPREIEERCMDYLGRESKFRSCRYDIIKSEKDLSVKTQNFEVIHHSKLQDGTYQCILTETLRQDLDKFQFDSYPLIRQLPIYGVIRMLRLHLNPVVVFIKLTSPSDISLLSAEEEEAIGKSVPYETILIQESEVSRNFPSVAEILSRDLLQLVTK